MADGVGDVVKRHLPVVVCLNSKGGVDPAELLHGQDTGDCQGLGVRVPPGQLWVSFPEIFHGLLAKPPHFPKVGEGGRRGVVCLPRIGSQGGRILQGTCRLICRVHQEFAEAVELLGGGGSSGEAGLVGEGGAVIIYPAVYQVQEEQRGRQEKSPGGQAQGLAEMEANIAGGGQKETVEPKFRHGDG